MQKDSDYRIDNKDTNEVSKSLVKLDDYINELQWYNNLFFKLKNIFFLILI